MTFAEEFRLRNFSIYGQWQTPDGPACHSNGYEQDRRYLTRAGIVSIVICLAVGIASIFSFNAIRIIFSIICIVSGLILIFVEVPFLLRICPTSTKFDAFIRRFTTNWMRAGMYAIMSAVQFASLCTGASSLIAAAVILIVAAIFYSLAGLKSQEFIGSKPLGGQGLAQMIV